MVKKKTGKKKKAKKKVARKTVGRKRKAAKKRVAKKRTTKRKTTKKRAAKKKTGRKVARKKVAKKKSKRKPNPQFMKPVTPDAALAAIVGPKPIPRTELTKRLWAYIKRNHLQDTFNRRNINADDKLRVVFGGKTTVNMFEMTKLVNQHVS